MPAIETKIKELMRSGFTRSVAVAMLEEEETKQARNSNKPGTIGFNICSARLAKSITQLALAHAIGMKGEDAGAHISRIESGQVEPKVSTLAKVASVLGVSLESLLTK